MPGPCFAPPGTVAAGATPRELIAQMEHVQHATRRPPQWVCAAGGGTCRYGRGAFEPAAKTLAGM